MAQPFSVGARAFFNCEGGRSVRTFMNFFIGLGIDLGWGFFLFFLIVLCVLFSTGVEARFIYTDF
jgi:hypothetical protein